MRKLLIFLITVIVSFSAYTQSDVRFGLTFSPQMAWLKIDNSEFDNEGTELGFNYGVLFDLYLNDIERYAFSTGLIISHTGGQYTFPQPQVDSLGNTIVASVSRNLNLQYVEVPVTLRLRTNEIGYITYYGQFGFAPGVVIRAREDREVTLAGVTTGEENIKANNINALNLALYLSAGIEYSLSQSTAILAGIYFNNGFTNVVNDDDSEKIALNNLGLRLGILF